MTPAPTDETFAWINDAVPRYDRFFGVDEHRERSRDLAAAHDHVTYEDVGESDGGEPLWAVTVGDGSRTAFLLGAPHPNEPIGSMTVDFLLHELASDDDLRERLDYEFVCVPVADVDGVVRNEGWFDGPFTLANYALNFYRPPPHRQVEATFPVERDDYSFDDPTPATRAIADLIEAHQPEFVYSLHNTGFGGCYYYLSDPLEPLHDALAALPEEYGIPLDRGEPEHHDVEAFDDGVYRLRGFDDRYEDLRESDGPIVEDQLLGGNARDYARQFDADVVQFVVELPYFQDPRIADRSELDRTRETVIRECVDRRLAIVEAVLDRIEPVSEHLPDTPMALEAEGVFRHFRDVYADKREWAEATAETDVPATVAQYVDARYVRQYTLLTYAGMLLRSIDNAAASADGDVRDALLNAKSGVEAVFHEQIRDMQDGLDYEAIPIWKLVAIQARAGLLCLDYRQDDA